MSKKTEQDPTGQARRRRVSTRKVVKRLKSAEKAVKALFKKIPKKRRFETVIRNEVVAIYDYEITPEEKQALNLQVDAILDNELLGTEDDTMPFFWWWIPVISVPFRQGTAESVVELNRLITEDLIDRKKPRDVFSRLIQPEDVFQTDAYLAALSGVLLRNFKSFRTLSENTARQVNQKINAGLSAGNTPTTIINEISERFEIAENSAARTVDTEVNWAYTDGIITTAAIFEAQTKKTIGVIHISALLPTTRAWHAIRHQKKYTLGQQKKWWDEGANRINCYCSVRSTLL